MKILLNPYEEGSGISTYMLELARCLSKTEHEIFCIGDSTKTLDNISIIPSPPRAFSFLGKYCQLPPFSWIDTMTYGSKISKIVNQIKPDVFHTSDHLIGLSVNCPIISVGWDYPKSFSSCIKLASRYSSMLGLPYRTLRELEMSIKDYYSFRRATKIIALTTFVAEKLQSQNLPVVKIPYGITVRKNDRKKEFSSPCTIVFMGRHHVLTKRKGLRFLFEALTIIKKKHPAAQFTVKLIGEIPHNFHSIMSHYTNLKKHIKPMGLVHREESISIIKQAHIYAAPSLYDEWAVGVEEALMLGIPVIASHDNHSFVEMIGEDAGVLTDIKNSAKFAEDLERMMTDHAYLVALSSAAKSRIKKKFDWQVLLPQILSLYEDSVREFSNDT